jgi:hypothetical protein
VCNLRATPSVHIGIKTSIGRQSACDFDQNMHAAIGKERIKKFIGIGYFSFVCGYTQQKISPACTQLQQRFEDNKKFQ